MPFDPFQTQGQKPQEGKEIIDEIIKRLNQSSHRIQMLEQKLDRIENGMRGLDETVLVQLNELKIDLDRIAVKITDVSDRIMGLETEVARINTRLDKTATKSEVKQLETFIDLINPVTSQFVTKDELGRAMDDSEAKMKKTA
jgi:predicted  nucleic acid-binding Zn-ribbon protein